MKLTIHVWCPFTDPITYCSLLPTFDGGRWFCGKLQRTCWRICTRAQSPEIRTAVGHGAVTVHVAVADRVQDGGRAVVIAPGTAARGGPGAAVLTTLDILPRVGVRPVGHRNCRANA